MKPRSLKLPKTLDAKLTRYAASKGASASSVLREALAEYLAKPAAERGQPQRTTIGQLGADLAGCVDGPGDLSTNPKHLAQFGRPRR
jgi:Arc/MetJ-type ribon-helix-helix transcriptional regulator